MSRDDEFFFPGKMPKIDTFNVDRLSLRFQEDIRPMNDIVMKAVVEQRKLIYTLEARLLAGAEDREVVESHKTPQYQHTKAYFPASTRDAIKVSINHLLERTNQYLCNIRFSGWLFSKTQITAVERWFQTFRLTPKMRFVQRSELISWNSVPKTIINRKYCPHHHPSLGSRDCYSFLVSEPGPREDATFLRSAIPYLRDLVTYSDHLITINRGVNVERLLYNLEILKQIARRYDR